MNEALLEGRELRAGYGDDDILRGVDITVAAGEVVALFGANGAGKTTTLRTLAGFLPLSGGAVYWRGSEVRGPAHRRAREGLAFVAERAIFQQLTVEANLRVGRGRPAQALELFPELRPLLKRRTGLLSGGEQQMLALGRALASRPAVLLVDELSLGLAPIVVDRLLTAIRQAADQGVGALLVEQQVDRAISVADRGYVLTRGRITFAGTRTTLIDHVHVIEKAYLATDEMMPPARSRTLARGDVTEETTK